MRTPLSDETGVEASKKYYARSNGSVLRAIHTVEGQVRAMLLALQRKLIAKVLVVHKVITWLVEHAADILNKFAVGVDRRTAYEVIQGRKRHEQVMYNILCKPEDGLMTERWVRGIWLVKMALSCEHLVAVDDGDVCVSAAVRLLHRGAKQPDDFVCPRMPPSPSNEEHCCCGVLEAAEQPFWESFCLHFPCGGWLSSLSCLLLEVLRPVCTGQWKRSIALKLVPLEIRHSRRG